MTAPSPTPAAVYEAHDSSFRDQPSAIAGIVLACSIIVLLAVVVRLRVLSRKEEDVPVASLSTVQPVACDSLPATGAAGRSCEEDEVGQTSCCAANQMQLDVREDGGVGSPELDIPSIIIKEADSYKFTASVSDFSSLSEGSHARLQEAQGTSYTLQLTELFSTNT